MAHYAELDSNNVVKQVIVVSNADTSTAQGEEKESIGIAFCERLLGGTWVKTSYNGNIRKNYAGIGYTYDKDRDAFIPPKPYASWVLNETTCLWNSPVAYPTDVGTPEAPKFYQWDEPTQTWELVTT
jgi:hypothetical protein